MNHAARARALMTKLDVTFTDYGNHANADAPAGKAFTSTGCHSIALDFREGRSEGWRRLDEDLAAGLYDCDDADCQVCPDEGLRWDRQHWVKPPR